MDGETNGIVRASLGTSPVKKKKNSFGHCPNYLSPPPPHFGQLVHLFSDVIKEYIK